MASRRAKVEVLQPNPRKNGEGGPPRPRAAWDAGEHSVVCALLNVGRVIQTRNGLRFLTLSSL
jgi:hypothetical protein